MSTEADELITQEIVEAAERVIAEVGRAADANFACPLGHGGRPQGCRAADRGAGADPLTGRDVF